MTPVLSPLDNSTEQEPPPLLEPGGETGTHRSRNGHSCVFLAVSALEFEVLCVSLDQHGTPDPVVV